MSYEVLSWREFGRLLLETGDLDPVYNMMVNAGLGPSTRDRFLLAYWAFYDVGTAARIAEAPDYWEAFKAALPAAPRGRERRHFRGAKALTAAERLEQLGQPEEIVSTLFEPVNVHEGYETTSRDYQRLNFSDVSRRARSLPQFGPWIAFKIADMGERVRGDSVNFSDCELHMYRDPVQGAALLFSGDWKAPIGREELQYTVKFLNDFFQDYPAPPSGDRRVDLQEVETILCKYKSHYKGHYPLGNDIKDITEALERDRKTSPLADRLLEGVPTMEAQV